MIFVEENAGILLKIMIFRASKSPPQALGALVVVTLGLNKSPTNAIMKIDIILRYRYVSDTNHILKTLHIQVGNIFLSLRKNGVNY